jgi:hypothetical protein
MRDLSRVQGVGATPVALVGGSELARDFSRIAKMLMKPFFLQRVLHYFNVAILQTIASKLAPTPACSYTTTPPPAATTIAHVFGKISRRKTPQSLNSHHGNTLLA